MKKILVVCSIGKKRGEIVTMVNSTGTGYYVMRVKDNIKALENLQNSRMADLAIIGQQANADAIVKWVEENCYGIPIVFIGGCECESKKIYHTYREIDASALDQLPALINELIGPPDPLK